MYRQVKKILFPRNKSSFFPANRNFMNDKNIEVSEEVKYALANKTPVISLESTIITHGMPFPENVQCAHEVEQLVREQGVIPATIAIIKGKIKIGLSINELEFLADTKVSNPVKCSRRDLAYLVSNRLSGGTTICGTLILTNRAGIPIFASGGLGGVHRDADKTFDISADLTELGRCGVAVVSSGVKSILDIPKTLEYLETQGVFVATFGDTNDFPAFFARTSGSKAPYSVQTAIQAASIIKCSRDLHLQSGMLFAVPVPVEFAQDLQTVNSAIEEALKEAKEVANLQGKNITPFLLSRVAKLTGGKSLQSNIELIKNNAKTASEIAVALAKLESLEDRRELRKGRGRIHFGSIEDIKKRPMIIGGSNLDWSATLKSSEIKLDGRIHDVHFSYTAGGVARNICDALSKLGCPPNFISAIGDDEPGHLLDPSIPQESRHLLKISKGSNTAQCVIVLDKRGDCKFLLGEMDIHKQITPDTIRLHEEFIKTSPLIILDANLSLETTEEVLKLADEHSIPVFFEPTDVEISSKPFKSTHWKAIKFITPNLNELKHIASFFNVPVGKACNNIKEVADIAKYLVNYVDNIIVTLESDGVLIARKGLASDPLLNNVKRNEISVRHYPTNKTNNFVNVSGAGDCLAGGIIAAMNVGLSEERCMSVALMAAYKALFSQSAVPGELFGRTHEAWNTSALYKTIH